MGGSANLEGIFREEIAGHRNRITRDAPGTPGDMLLMGKVYRLKQYKQP
jgi:hypothetical protein